MKYINERLTGQRVFPDRWISDVWAAGDEQPIHPNPSILVSQKQLALKGLKSHLTIFQQRGPCHHSVANMQMEFLKCISAPNKSVKNGVGIMDGVVDGRRPLNANKMGSLWAAVSAGQYKWLVVSDWVAITFYLSV